MRMGWMDGMNSDTKSQLLSNPDLVFQEAVDLMANYAAHVCCPQRRP